MPHRPQGQQNAASPQARGGSGSSSAAGVEASLYTPPRVPGTTAAAIMRQPGGSSGQAVAAALMYGAVRSAAATGVVTPLVGNNKAWLAAGNVSNNALPSLDSRNKSSDSTDTRSMGNASHHTDVSGSNSVATLATENDDREATASALLMVAKAAEREHLSLNAIIHAASLASAGSSSSSTMPLKKRLRRQQNEQEEDSMSEATDKEVTNTSAAEQDPCHISPVSHSSAEHNGLRTESTEEGGTPPTRRIFPQTNNKHANRTSSYDSKDVPMAYKVQKDHPGSSSNSTTQELLDSSKVHSTAQIGIIAPKYPSQVMIPHFPTLLHQVLSDKEFDGKVVQWLADGEAFKVLRWDALRRQVLPRYFSDLRDETGGGCGTIDAFLFHLSAWGFAELKDGTDVGAYRHDLFIRGAQKLCVKMRFTGDMGEYNRGPNAVSPHRPRPGDNERSMLQVPTLTTREMAEGAMPPQKRARYDGPPGPPHWPYGESPAVWGGQFLSDAHHMYGMRGAATSYPFGADPRMPIRRSSTPESLPPAQHYSPPQVRSGRGAMRIASNRAATSPSTTPVARQGISVSNRGKGPRKPAAVRSTASPIPKPDATASPTAAKAEEAQSSPASAAAELSEAQRIGSSVAVAISRKTKRKLPMAAKKAEEDASSVTSVKADTALVALATEAANAAKETESSVEATAAAGDENN
ncbi:MAG: hypothetical protein SGILL_007178 [Bacillariaceae sp.]